MPLTLQRADLPALTRGFAALGAGGAGAPDVSALVLRTTHGWPVTLHAPDELDPGRPCIAIAYAGSTFLLEEHLPGSAPFAPAVAAVERWLGHTGSVVCNLESAGLNGLSNLYLAGERDVVDADGMGRGFPDLDQFSVVVDGRPGLVAAVATGPEGVTLVENVRPADLERVMRTAIECNGGWSGFAIGGFTVGDLAEHAILGSTARARAIGQALIDHDDRSPAVLAEVTGGRLLGLARVTATHHEQGRSGLTTYELRGADGAVLRLVARTEFLAVLVDGRVAAASPSIIVALDAVTRRVLQIEEIATSKDLILLSLPAPEWWNGAPHRLAAARPSRWGLSGLDEETVP